MLVRRFIFTLISISIFCSGLHAQTFKEVYNRLLEPGRRRGLIAHVDVGGGASFVDYETSDLKSDITKGTIGVIGGVGYATSDQFIIQFSLRWSVYTSTFDKTGQTVLFFLLGPFGPFVSDAHMLAGGGVSYYFRRNIPSWFIEAGVGYGVITNPYDTRDFISDDYEGIGFYTGVGYEFSRHYYVELNYWWTKADKEYSTRSEDWVANSLVLTVGVMGY